MSLLLAVKGRMNKRTKLTPVYEPSVAVTGFLAKKVHLKLLGCSGQKNNEIRLALMHSFYTLLYQGAD